MSLIVTKAFLPTYKSPATDRFRKKLEQSRRAKVKNFAKKYIQFAEEERKLSKKLCDEHVDFWKELKEEILADDEEETLVEVVEEFTDYKKDCDEFFSH